MTQVLPGILLIRVESSIGTFPTPKSGGVYVERFLFPGS